MSNNALPRVKAVRERTFATPGGRYAVRLYAPTVTLPYGRSLVRWEVVRVNEDRTRVVVARGEGAMRNEMITASFPLAAMLCACVEARRNRVGVWVGEPGNDASYALQLWAYYRQDVRTSIASSPPGYFGEFTAPRGVRMTRQTWARYFGWEFPPGYAAGKHLRPDKRREDAAAGV